MKNRFFIGAIMSAILVVGCGQKDNARNSQVGTAKSTAQSGVTNQVLTAGTPAPITVQTPVMQPILTAWQEGNGPAAIARFTGANWNARPLFPASMAVGLTESQFKGLSGSDRNLRNNEMMAQLDLIKQIVMTINEAGQDAAAKGDNIRALKLFTALNQCGAALDDPAAQILVKQVGQVCKGMGGRGLAKLGQ